MGKTAAIEKNADQVNDAKSSSKPKAEEPLTLAGALKHKDNRDVATMFAAFTVSLAVVPIGGLVICEWLLRQLRVVEDDAQRWMYSGFVAVLLVNVVLCAYVVCCYLEGFPAEADDKLKKL